MKMNIAKVKGFLRDQPFIDGELRILYFYQSNVLPPNTYLSRLPYTLCSLRDAGFTELSGSVDISVVTDSTTPTLLSQTKACINTSAVTQLNCSDPSRADISVLLSRDGCSNKS
jgi:hypothetical protein